MRIRITEIVVGYPDGVTRTTYNKGEVYEVGTPAMPQGIADCFLVIGSAEELADVGPSETKVVQPSETKPKGKKPKVK